GAYASWQLLRSEEGGYFMTRMAFFDPHEAPVVAFSPSLRDKGFISADAKGGVHLNHSTTVNTLARLKATSDSVRAAAMSPRADGIVTLDAAGKTSRWEVKNPHPESTIHSLFGSVWYEGYPGPEMVWQSTGATDDFEPKFGLIPLIFGTLKGTFYALIM